MKTHSQIGIALLLGTGLLAGCNSSPQSAPGSGTNANASSGAATTVVYIPKNTGNPYFNQVIEGFKSTATAKNITFDTQAPAKADATSQIPIIKDQIQRGVDAIVISSNSPDALNEVLDQARQKGIAVITLDSDLTGNESHRDVGVLPTDPANVGKTQIELLGSMMNYQGDFAILSATADAPNQNVWIAGMKDTLAKDPKYAKMKLVAVVYGDDEPQKSSTEAEALLTKYPNLKGIEAPTSVGLAAAAQVLENAGSYPGGPNAKNGGIILTGLSTPNQLKKAVQKGVVQKFQLWDPALMGIIAADLATQIHNANFKPTEGSSLDVPNVGKVTIGPKNTIFAGPLLTFDKSNIDKYNF